MPQTIDVTGLPPEAVRAVESLVGILRAKSPTPPTAPPSVFDLFGKAPHLRTGEEIAQQIRDERTAWDES